MHHKTLLPTYDVFDEDRYFEPATRRRAAVSSRASASGSRSARTSGTIATSGPTRLYARDPVCELADQGADVLINISSSPFDLGKAASGAK